MKKDIEISKFLSLVLRHTPSKVNLNIKCWMEMSLETIVKYRIFRNLGMTFTFYTTLLLFIMLCFGCATPNLEHTTSYLMSEEISTIGVYYQKVYYKKYETIGISDTIFVEKPITGGEFKGKAIEFSFNEKEINDSLRQSFITFFKQSRFLQDEVTTFDSLGYEKPLYNMDSTFISFQITFKNTVTIKLSSNFTNYSAYDKNKITDESSLLFYNLHTITINNPFGYDYQGGYLSYSHKVKSSLVQGDVIVLFNKLATMHNSNSPDSSRKITLLPPSVRIKE